MFGTESITIKYCSQPTVQLIAYSDCLYVLYKRTPYTVFTIQSMLLYSAVKPVKFIPL